VSGLWLFCRIITRKEVHFLVALQVQLELPHQESRDRYRQSTFQSVDMLPSEAPAI